MTKLWLSYPFSAKSIFHLKVINIFALDLFFVENLWSIFDEIWYFQIKTTTIVFIVLIETMYAWKKLNILKKTRTLVTRIQALQLSTRWYSHLCLKSDHPTYFLCKIDVHCLLVLKTRVFYSRLYLAKVQYD